jgi:uncharacterized membrane protein
MPTARQVRSAARPHSPDDASRRIAAIRRSALAVLPARRHSTPTQTLPAKKHAMALSGPAVTIHVALALGALALGPLALAARKGSRLHRATGYAWVTLMLGAALSSIFIRDFKLPNIAGYTPIHIVTLLTFAGIGVALYFVFKRNIRAHRRAMWITYINGCVGAGVLALLPRRTLGQLVWHQWLMIV